MTNCSKIVLPTRPQIDTVIALFILKSLGDGKFPGIKNAGYEVWPVLPAGETPESLENKGIVLIDVGGGKFDHHSSKNKVTASSLISEYLGVKSDPALAKLLAFAERDDFFGKGIVSNDPLDRAFGLPGLMANLNRSHSGDPAHVFNLILPLIEAHYEEESRRTKEMPLELETKTKAGEVETFSVKQKDNNLKVIIISTDNPSMAGYLRSQLGGRFDVVAQRSSTGHVNVLTRPTKRPRLEDLAAVIRLEEIMRSGKDMDLGERELVSAGRLKEVPEWYYDPATNSIQNGGVNPKDIPATKIGKKDWKDILTRGLAGQVWDKFEAEAL